MKVLFINPPNKPFTSQGLITEPIDALGVATFIKKLGHEVRFIDMDAKRMAVSDADRVFEDYRPDVAVIIFDYHIPLFKDESIGFVRELSALAGRRFSLVVLGGKIASYGANIFEGHGVDVIVRGEMEGTLEEILSRHASRKSFADVSGIYYAADDKLKATSERGRSIDIKELSIPDRSLVDLSDYIDVRTMLTSRGCNQSCAFCPTPGFWGVWRARSSSQVVDEIEELVVGYCAKKIMFLDDNAMARPERMREISCEIIRRGIKCSMGCLGSPTTFDEASMQKMYEAGFRWIHYGIESGDLSVLERSGKPMNFSQMRGAILGAKKIGFRVRASFILDLPGAGIKSFEETRSLIVETEPHEIRFHYFVPRMGSRVYDGKFASQDIHLGRPSVTSGEEKVSLEDHVNEIVNDLSKSYVVVRDPEYWANTNMGELSKSNPEMKYLSFCPMQYGIGWEDPC